MNSHFFCFPMLLRISPRHFSKIGRRSRVLGLAGALALLSVSGSAWAEEEAGSSEREEDGTVLALVRAPAPKVLVEKMLEVARRIQPGPQTESLPFMLGGMLGDPMLEGISATENIGVAFVADGSDVSSVLILNLTEESPWRETLPGFQMALMDHKGWTLALPENVSSSLVEGREEELISAVRESRRYDVEVTLNTAAIARTAGDLVGTVPGVDTTGWGFALPVVEGMVSEVDSIRDLRLGMNLSGDQIEQVYYVQAEKGSPMAEFFDQKRPEDFSFARVLAADEPVAVLGGFDIEATLTYFDQFLGRLTEEAEGEAEAWWRKMGDLSRSYLESTNGASASVVSLDGMQLQMATVAPSAMRDEELVAMLEDTVEIIDAVMAFNQDDQPLPSYELMLNRMDVGGVSVHVMRTEVRMDPEEEAEIEERMPEAFAFPDQRQDMHYALVEGLLVTASDPERMRSLIQRIRSGEAAKNDLASEMSIGKENLFELRVDLVRYFGGVMTAFVPEKIRNAIEELERQELEPLRGSLSARGGEAELRLSLPVDTLAAIYRQMAEAMAAAQEQAIEPPDAESDEI